LRQNGHMAMRTDCKHYESRTYSSGETVRKCRIDLAPEAPWRCPADCPRYERRMVDVAWDYGSLKDSVASEPEEPPALDDSVTMLLDEAENIVNAAGADIVEESREAERKGWKRFTPKSRKRKKRKR
jgi:hypothetical protein